jgi:hypothetical protein
MSAPRVSSSGLARGSSFQIAPASADGWMARPNPAMTAVGEMMGIASPSRGEEGAPSLRPARNRDDSAHVRREGLSDLGAPGGGARFACRYATPTRNAIELRSPVACAVEVCIGALSPWRSNLPPPGGGNRVARAPA